MAINFDNALAVHSQALNLRARRAELMAGNLANAETPNYLARDLDFRQAMQSAMGQGQLTVTHDKHMAAPGDTPAQPLYRVPAQPAIDGNTVDPLQEKAAFADNAVRYQTTLTLLSSRVRGIISAVRGGK